MATLTATEFCCLLKSPTRLKGVIESYLLSLALPAPKHSLQFASEVSGLNKSQFSRLLQGNSELARTQLEQLSKIVGQELARRREPLIAGAPWTVALIVDATLHGRSSLHVQNAQRFNHGEGFVIGHQWTNLVLVVNDQVIPLPPIAFLTKKECRRLGKKYKTEHEHIVTRLKEINLSQWLGEHDSSEVVVLMDAGYDNKEIQRTILDCGWDFICALKKQRSVQTLDSHEREGIRFKKVCELFRRVRRYAPWETVRIKSAASKKKQKQRKLRVRRLEGNLKGILRPMVLLCSEKSRGKGHMYLACSNQKISTRQIVIGYTIRWRIEMFHRDVKNNLGMLDAGVVHFESQRSHVHWVYCAYLLLNRSKVDVADLPGRSVVHRQRKLGENWEKEKYRKIIQLSTRFDGAAQVKRHCQEVISDEKAA